VGQYQEFLVGPDDTDRRSRVPDGVLALLGDEELLEGLATGRTSEPVPVFHVHRRSILLDELQAVAVVVDGEPVGHVERFHTPVSVARGFEPIATPIRQVHVSPPGPSHMDLRVIDKSDTELSIEIAGEDHTVLNVLKGALLEADGVAAATYDVNPEQSGGQTEPILTIKTEAGVDALDALENAAERVSEKSTELRDAYQAAD